MSQSINDNILCSYGCGNFANFITKHGKPCCSETFYKCPGYRKRQSIDAKNRPPSIPKGTILKPKTYHPGKCEICGKDHDGTYGSGRFCSQSCARKASSINCNKEDKNRKISQSLKMRSKDDIYESSLKSVITYNKNHPNNKINLPIKCEVNLTNAQKRRFLLNEKCKICGNIICTEPQKCLHMAKINIEKYNSIVDISKLGTPLIYEEYEKFKNYIHELYVDKKYSTPQISKILNVSWISVMLLLKKFNIIKRNRSESAINAILDNDKQLFCNKNQYKCGYHITWEGKKFWLRSSYEFDYAKQLDEQKISYDVESIRIPYKSSISGKTKIMIPDFYIKDTNTVIEIKSDFTYNELDWIDRVRVLKEKGYNCKLILEKVEYNCDVIPKQRIQNNIDSLL